MVKTRVEKPKDYFFQPIPGLVPIGDTGLYRTPDEPADPMDCERYPSSPFCEGGTFQKDFVSLAPKITKNNCDIGIEFSPVFGFISVPKVDIVYRQPECRGLPDSGDVGELQDVIEGLAGDLVSEDYFELPPLAPGCRYIAIWEMEHPLLEKLIEWDLDEQGNYLFSLDGRPKLFRSDDVYLWYYVSSFDINRREWHIIGAPTTNIEVCRLYHFFNQARERGSIALSEAFYNRLKTPYAWSNDLGVSDHSNPYKIPYTLKYVGLRCGENVPPKHLYKKKKRSFQPPPPKPPKRKCCMGCCPSNNSNNDELVRFLIQRVEKLHEKVGDKNQDQPTSLFDGLRKITKFLGIQRMPAKLPKRLIYPNGKGEETLNDLPEIIGYVVKQIDRAVGYLPQTLKFKDTNAAKAGDQSLEIQIHSFADFSREVLQYLIDTEGDTDASNNMLVRLLYEVGLIHQGSVQGNAMIDAIVEHLDFKHRWKSVRVPFAFDPYAGSKGFGKKENSQGSGVTINSDLDKNTEEATEKLLPSLLKNTEVEIRVLVNDEKVSLNQLLQEISRNAGLASAGVAEKSDPNRLEDLVAAAQSMIQLQGAIDRLNTTKALSAGDLRTRKKK